MASSEFLENYRLAEPTIRKLYDSGLRLAILDALSKGPMRLADLRRAVDSNAPNTSSKAKELEEMELVERQDGLYTLTPFGRSALKKVTENIDFCCAHEKFRGYWSTHNIEDIPSFLLDRLGDLKNSNLIGPCSSNVVEVHDRFIKALNSAESRIYGAVPIFQEAYFKAGVKWIERGIDVQMLLTDEILSICAKLGGEKVAKLCDGTGKFKAFRIDELPLALMVSESYMTLALKSKQTGSLVETNLWSTDPTALQWMIDLFEHFKKQAMLVNLEDYL